MILNLFITLLLLFSFNSFGQIVLGPTTTQMVEVGDLVEMDVVSGHEFISEEMIQNKFGLKDQSKILFMSLVRKDGAISAKAVIASKFNPTEQIPLEGNGGQLSLSFQNLQFNSMSSTKKEFKYIDIPLIPERTYLNYLKWLIAIVSLAAVVAGVALGLKRYLQIKKVKKIRASWIVRLESANTLSSCSQIWLERERIRTDFPDLIDDINQFFNKLSPDQFQLSSREELKSEVRVLKDDLIKKMRERKLGV